MPTITNLDEANSKIAELSAEIERLKGMLAVLRERSFGRRGEKIDPNQLMLFESNLEKLNKLKDQAEADASSNEADGEKREKTRKKKKKGHGRPPFADHLERVKEELDVPKSERACGCGKEMRRIGTEVTEQGFYIPARMGVRRYERARYGCPDGCCIAIAPLPDSVIDKGKYEASVYAHIVTAKYADHVPLHRLQGIFRRQGFNMPKQTMWDLVARFDEIAAQPILAEMRRQLLEEQDLQTDETTIKVRLEGEKRGTRRGILWVWRNVRGSPVQKVVADFKDDRSAKGPDAFLGDWTGTLLTDGYDGVNPAANRNDITRAGCWAHARRKFRDALNAGAVLAGPILRLIQRLFWIEQAIKIRAEKSTLGFEGLAELRLEVRRRRSRALLRTLYDAAFTLQENPAALGNDLLKKALTYLVNQRDSLLAHLDNGRIPIHNNDTERDLRHVVIGRKNWMTFASERGGLVAGRLYSLAMSCKLAGIDIEAYLEDVLSRVATTPSSQIAELTPWGWAAARAAEKADLDASSC